MNFPSSPTVGQTYALGSKTWVWNGSAWDLQSAAPNNLTLDYVQLNTSATVTDAVGRIRWDADQGTADLGLLGGNIVQRLGQSLVAYVTNAEAVTITKGQAVYLFSATGDRASVKLAYNTGDATSAKTLGLVAEDIAAGASGFVMCQGVAYKMNTAAYTAGDFLYLGATAGALTTTKPYAPNHLVYIGTVEKTNAGNGQIYVRVQNGYELDELHNVAAQSPTTGQTIVWNGSTSLWEKNTVSLTAGVNGTLPVANGGTGQTSYTDGQLLIGNTTGNTLSKATLTAGSNITITNGNGSITIASTASGSGDVVGPASATNNGVALFDGTTGKLLKNSASQDGLIYGLTVGRGAGGVSSNTALGSGALNNASTTGGFNTALGRNTLQTLTSGEENTAVGNSVLNLATTGSNNVGVGNASLAATTTGGSNTALGVGALQRNTSASFNTAIGTQALTYNTTASNNTAVGYQALYTNTTGTELVAVGYQAGYSITTGSRTTAVGYQAANATTTGSVTAVGHKAALSNTTGVGNIGIGLFALTSNTTGNYNTAVGADIPGSNYGALYSNTTGSSNTALGNSALYSNTTASNNTAVGYRSLYANTTGATNAAFGDQCLLSNTTAGRNTAVGHRALAYTTTGGQNTTVGYYAAEGNTTGVGNVCVGDYAGVFISTGSDNVCIGKYAGYNQNVGPLTTGSQNILIGVDNGLGSSSDNYTIVVGIGRGKGGSTGFINPNSGGVYQGNNSSSWSTTSDQRLKKNIADNNDGLDKINSIRVRNFEYRVEDEITELPTHCAIEKTGVQLGVIAQELQAVLPECVKQESTGVLSVDTDNLTWYLINAVKELSARIKQLEGN